MWMLKPLHLIQCRILCCLHPLQCRMNKQVHWRNNHPWLSIKQLACPIIMLTYWTWQQVEQWLTISVENTCVACLTLVTIWNQRCGKGLHLGFKFHMSSHISNKQQTENQDRATEMGRFFSFWRFWGYLVNFGKRISTNKQTRKLNYILI